MTAVATPRRFVRSQPRAVAVAAEADADARWDPLIASVVAYTFVSVGRIHQLFPVLEILHPAVLTAGAAFVLAVMDRRPTRRLGPVLQYSTVRWLLALLVWSTLSIPGALWPGGAFSTVFDRLVKSVAMSVVTIIAVRGPRDVHRIAVAFFASVAVFACVVITRYDISLTGGRLLGMPYYDANDYALLEVISLPIGAYAFAFTKNLFVRGFALVGFAAMAVTFIWTGSRGGFLALGVTALAGLFLLRSVPVRWRIGGVMIVTMGVALSASDGYWKRMETLDELGTDYNVTERSGRIAIWKRGITYMLDHPVLGVGAGNFGTAEGKLSPHAYLQSYNVGVKWSAAHNTFVQAGAELGIPGLLFFVGAIVTTFGAVRRVGAPSVTRDKKLRVLADLCSVSYLGFVVGAVFLSMAYHDVLYAVHGLAMSIVKGAMMEARST